MYPVALGGAVLVIVLAIVLAVQLTGGNDEGDDAAVATAPASLPTATAGDTGSSEAGSGGSGGASDSEPSDAAQATLTAGSTDLLPLSGGAIANAAGQEVSGVRLAVVDVAGDDGFFIAENEGDRERLFVDHDDSSYVPGRGDVVSLRGQVRRTPSGGAAELGLDEAQARSVSERGVYVEADTVTPQGAQTGGDDGAGASGDSDSNAPPGDRP